MLDGWVCHSCPYKGIRSIAIASANICTTVHTVSWLLFLVSSLTECILYFSVHFVCILKMTMIPFCLPPDHSSRGVFRFSKLWIRRSSTRSESTPPCRRISISRVSSIFLYLRGRILSFGRRCDTIINDCKVGYFNPNASITVSTSSGDSSNGQTVAALRYQLKSALRSIELYSIWKR
jgi:hypothetical protein